MRTWIYKDIGRNEKCRLIRAADNHYICECKSINGIDLWHPYFIGTSEYMQLTEQDKSWAIDKRLK